MNNEEQDESFLFGGQEDPGDPSTFQPAPRIDRDRLIEHWHKAYGVEKDELDKLYPKDEDLLAAWQEMKESRRLLVTSDAPDTEAELEDDYKPTKLQIQRAAEIKDSRKIKAQAKAEKKMPEAEKGEVKTKKGKSIVTEQERKEAMEALLNMDFADVEIKRNNKKGKK